ncbi:MAG: hypothetical protein Q9208_004993 [Pyrenodesmia sp. 3 TL-2023]
MIARIVSTKSRKGNLKRIEPQEPKIKIKFRQLKNYSQPASLQPYDKQEPLGRRRTRSAKFLCQGTLASKRPGQPLPIYESFMATRPRSAQEKAADVSKQMSGLVDERAFLLSLLEQRASLPGSVQLNTRTRQNITAALNGKKSFTEEELDLKVSAAVLETRVKVKAELLGPSDGRELLTRDEFENKMQREILGTRKKVLSAIARSEDLWGKNGRGDEVVWPRCWEKALIYLGILWFFVLVSNPMQMRHNLS